MHDEKAARVWSDPESLATTQLLLLVDRYGVGALQWTPQTMVSMIKRDTGVDLRDGNLDRLMAGCSLMTRPDHFYTIAADFEFLCRMLSHEGDHARPKFGELALSHDVLWGCVEASLLHPPDRGWGDEVKKYIEVMLAHDGFTEIPPILKMVGPKIETFEMGYHHEEDEDVKKFYEIGRNSLTKELNEWITYRLKQLAEQLEQLPVESASIKQTAQRIRKIAGE